MKTKALTFFVPPLILLAACGVYFESGSLLAFVGLLALAIFALLALARE